MHKNGVLQEIITKGAGLGLGLRLGIIRMLETHIADRKRF